MNSEDKSGVRELQEYLRRLSRTYPAIPELAVDGLFGPETEEAVKAFQGLFGLPVTGEADGDTWDALKAEYDRLCLPEGRAQPLYPFPRGDTVWETGDTGPAVTILQAALDTVCDHCGKGQPVPCSGTFDEVTAEYVKWLQKLCGFEQTGRVDRRTWDMLALTYNAYVGC